MKRISLIMTCMVAMMSISVTSLWAVWEGNAGIAAKTEFPSAGMYARSDMFPKNTIVDILNLEKDITVRVVITGSSGIPGLVALLSPETAAALNIQAGSVSRVRISIPSPVQERPASGTVSDGTTTENKDPDINPAVAASQAKSNPLESVVKTEENPLVPLTTQNIAAEEPAVETIPLETPVAPVATVETAIPENAVAETNMSESVLPDPVLEEPTVVYSSAEAPVAIESNTFYDEPEIEIASAETEIVTATEPVEEPLSEPILEPILDTSELSTVTLVPADLNPPEATEFTNPGDIPVIESISEDVTIPTIEIAQVPVEPIHEDIFFPYVTSFIKGGYYIQIASYSNPLNAKKVLDSYAPRYPMVVEKANTSKGELLKVFIGPVQKDEYGAVLERFKGLGFKESFVKKGQ